MANWKTKLNHARWLRGIYFIDPEDKEFKETIKDGSKTHDFKSKFACTLPPET